MEAGEHVAEVLRARRQHQRQANSRVHAVATADPIPKSEHVVGVDTEAGHPFGIGRQRNEVFGRCRFIPAEAIEEPGASAPGVRQRLESGEGLRRNDKQRGCRVESFERLMEVRAIDVGDETCLDHFVAVSR